MTNIEYVDPGRRVVWTSIPVLPFLWGRTWSARANDLIASLRPSTVRMSTGEVKSDSRLWRVTVYLVEGDIIRRIEQEVEVGGVCFRDGTEASSYIDYCLSPIGRMQ